MDTEQLMMKKSLYEGETWLGKPPEIEESRIEKTMEADVVVVGAGLAGVAAGGNQRRRSPGQHGAPAGKM